MKHVLVGWLALVVAALLAAAGAGEAPAQIAGPGQTGPSPVIFPTQTIPLSFSHQQHLAKEKLDCAFCHEAAPGSKRASDSLIPSEQTCTTCHAIERDKPDKQVAPGEPDARCDSCHPGWNGRGQPPRVVVPTPNLKFSHRIHTDRKIRCQTCHGDLLAEGVGLGTRENLPRMSLCLGCHDGQIAPRTCTTCHMSAPGGLVRTEYAEGRLMPSGVLRGDAHDPSFRAHHAEVAAQDAAYCGNCHTQKYCQDCHNGVVKPLEFHANDYVSIHPIDARRNQPDCQACHRLQTFCTGCHARTGVSPGPTSEFDRQNGRLFHPPGWVPDVNVAGAMRPSNHHSFQAQRNIRTCVSCHREDFCLGCHIAASPKDFGQSLGVNMNPHPAGWASSSRCASLRARAGRMCLRCHADPDEARCN